MRKIVAVCAAVAAVAVAPIAAPASHCGSRIVVFSRNDVQRQADLGAVNPNAVVCELNTAEVADTRLLVPLATEIWVRYTEDLGPEVLELKAAVSGLGINETLTLERRNDPTTGLVSYGSAVVNIPAGSSASGTVRVTITLPGGSDTVCFHTWNASCS